MKLKEIDNYTYSLILILLGGFSILGMGKNKISVYIPMILLFSSIVIIYYTYKRGTGEIVSNDYEGEAYTKTEDGDCEPQKLQAEQTRTGIDGIITQYDKDRVFKVSNGIKVKILKNGKIRETTLVGRIMNIGYTNKFKNENCLVNLFNKIFFLYSIMFFLTSTLLL